MLRNLTDEYSQEAMNHTQTNDPVLSHGIIRRERDKCAEIQTDEETDRFGLRLH